jgi:hypothetical protein
MARRKERTVAEIEKDGGLEVRVPLDRTKAEAHKIPVQRT